jgi:ferritin-like metal-binding protein YciE
MKRALRSKKNSDTHAGFFQLFVDELREMYSVEQQIIKTLPKLVKLASENELKTALNDHLKETKNHKERLDKIFAELKISTQEKTCKAMEMLLKEGEKLILKEETPALRDAAIIASAQKVEHYEMAVYGTLRTFASYLKYPKIQGMLQDTLNEEGAADKKLTQIAEGSFFGQGVNQAAANE